ncbi:nitric oxide reductase, NorC subunit apoprotein [Lutibacter agarilyticus]|uniref:Nitric oxide reductase, NorC subunit apoprotein n=1 Tax=Lutibacter agarilyticus TaxID=1109740 RepID=A0A238YGS8_9FLAO|nr:cytochrome c [Lutibacter agarilyticus]SNR70337.1 nitric oxide reductase, NorC subunit apoprotein [Lutibacter agarilyticus]
MLSKKQARAFFLGGTLVTFLIFIGLTIFSLSKGSDQTNQENLSADVVRGKEIWESNNCMGCHTILGEGAYYAPELTKVIDRLNLRYDGNGEQVIKSILMSEGPWQPNGRKMVAYGMTEAEAADVVAFFKWIGEIDLNGFGKVVGVDRKISPLAKEKINN